MEKSILLILVGNRTESALKVQEILTNMGCFIKTRLGLHEATENACSDTGLLILELIGSEEDKKKLVRDLEGVPDVRVNLVNMSL